LFVDWGLGFVVARPYARKEGDCIYHIDMPWPAPVPFYGNFPYLHPFINSEGS
jgi:hypothetical protein